MNGDKTVSEIFIEAESFEEKGGWVIDQQSMPVIHSAYLMAHGMGVPVKNARTKFNVNVGGEYKVFCLTRDWTKTWDIEDSAGKFDLIIDGRRLENTLGTNGSAWGWQLAGRISLNEGVHTMELSDLTGFNGRCDCIYMTTDELTPSDGISDIDAMRKRLNYKDITVNPKEYDLIVVGGGISGICTALSALNSSLSALIITDRPVLGGCNSSEIRVCMGGQIKNPPYAKLGDVVKNISPVFGFPDRYEEKYFEDDRKLLAFEFFRGSVRLNEHVSEIEKDGDKITAVICTSTVTGKKTKYKAKIFADCSGDAVLARLGGATLMYGKEARSEFNEPLAQNEHKNTVMGHSIRWYSEKTKEKSPFPCLNWKLDFNDENYLKCVSGDWEQETGFNRHMINEMEYIRDYGLRAIYANWSFQKHQCAEKEKYENLRLKWVSFLGGKRESYRVVGDYILTEHDLEAETEYEDGTAGITWGVDIHFPERTNEREFGEAFRSFAYHRGMPRICNVPYRCLYSKDIKNLFLGGRSISASHVAFSAVRVMRTLGMLGEVVGMAATLCKKYNCLPRDIYESHLDDLKKAMEAGIYFRDAFSFCEVNNTEKYHFKDIGWWDLDTRKADSYERKDKEKFWECINEWNIPHKHDIPEDWK